MHRTSRGILEVTPTLRASLLLSALAPAGCSSHPAVLGSPALTAQPSASTNSSPSSYLGFDRNDYPGDDRLAALHQHFVFTGFWLNNPPGAQHNTWSGHRPQLLAAGFGFLVLWNGRLDAQIKHANVTPETLGRQDAQDAIAAARREGFPVGAILFLDQEEGGRLLPEQSAYFFAFTETIAASAFRAGAYLSGQPSPDGTGPNGQPATITTAQDVQQTIAAKHYHPVALWVAQDACPPAPGCTVESGALSHLAPRNSGTPEAIAWQFAQSPQRPALTHACAKTYAADGNCYAGVTPDLFLDLNLANSPDPSHGR